MRLAAEKFERALKASLSEIGFDALDSGDSLAYSVLSFLFDSQEHKTCVDVFA